MTKELVVFTGGLSDDQEDEIELLDRSGAVRLSGDVVKRNLREFVDGLGEVLSSVSLKKMGYQLESVSVAVGIDGKGTVGFLGTGAEAGASATLTLEFKRL